ncbi:HYC_CC_PP family protein [Niabella insulamsoli]|uniref:HYC_CC_PP family protein n=1 Tax=Niabella insulamsoli TaxID=3144874 RepID=UPI003D108C06
MSLICYLLLSNGVMAATHYCMDQLAAVSLLAPSKAKCGKCGMPKKDKGCCEDKAVFLKLATDHVKDSHFVSGLKQPVAKAIVLITPLLPVESIRVAEYKFLACSLPPPKSNDLYLKNQVFRI